MPATVSSDRVSDVTDQQPLFGHDRPEMWPYHTRYWGQVVSGLFGGTFRTLRIELPDPVLLPVIVGGSLAEGGFCSGHIGYGGAVPEAAGTTLDASDHVRAVVAAQEFLDLPCRRLVTPPLGEAALPQGPDQGERRRTYLVDLAGSEQEQLSSYARSLPGSVRKALRSGVEVRLVTTADAGQALALVHLTQAEVGATYRMPRGLLDALVDGGPDFGTVLGCWYEGRLISVGVFLRTGGNVGYLATGWDRTHAKLRANYLMVHHALRYFADRGDRVVDLGYSHQPGIVEFKRQWGSRPADSLDLSAAVQA
ncbi:hypothetical protein GCM10017562_65120 [Streptomyces roseofulvus]|uniref:GNAT family N-acetyltransferase n=1 Tax=Streptomyces roseofulvus TaxID=33902 RepID=UPI0031FD95F9